MWDIFDFEKQSQNWNMAGEVLGKLGPVSEKLNGMMMDSAWSMVNGDALWTVAGIFIPMEGQAGTGGEE